MAALYHAAFACRVGCGACCIAPSIVRPIPGMAGGKPAGVRCVNLDANNQCRLWGSAEYPETCRGFRAEAWLCGDSQADAMSRIEDHEQATRTQS